MADLAIVAGPNPAVGGGMPHGRMTLSAEMVGRLGQESVVFAPVRVMALGTAPLGHGITSGGFVFIRERPPLGGMTITTDPGQVIFRTVIQPLEKPMTTQAGDIALHNRVLRPPRETGRGFVMARQAKAGPIVEQERFVIHVDFMAPAAIHFLDGMDVETIIIEADVGKMTLRAGGEGVVAG